MGDKEVENFASKQAGWLGRGHAGCWIERWASMLAGGGRRRRAARWRARGAIMQAVRYDHQADG